MRAISMMPAAAAAKAAAEETAGWLETMGHEVAPADFLAMLSSTLFAAPAYQGYGGMIAAERYTPAGFKLPLGLKDVRLALATAAPLDLPPDYLDLNPELPRWRQLLGL